MDWKLFASTFALIFLAELGDKTQLAVLAASAGSRSVISVMLGAILALALSTIVAVGVASALNRAIPAHWLQAGAAALFVAFGLILGHTALQGFRGIEAPTVAPAREEAPLPESAFGRWIMREAAVFEEELLDDLYRLIAETAPGPLRAQLEALAEEDASHIEHLRELHPHRETPIHAEPSLALVAPQRQAKLNGNTLLQHILDRERAIERFYSGLAHATHLPRLASLFSHLAEEEQRHIRQWEKLLADNGV